MVAYLLIHVQNGRLYMYINMQKQGQVRLVEVQ